MNRHQYYLPLFLVLAAAFAPGATAQFIFDTAVSYVIGNQPDGVAAGDFDGDGDADLAATVDLPDRVEILINNGDGSYIVGGSILLPASSSPGDIVSGDLDGDTDVDLAVALKDFNQVIVLPNDGTGAFTTGGSYATGLLPRDLDIGDLDGDLDLDLLTGNRDGNNATVLINVGGAVFSPTNYAAGNDVRGATFGDFDNDTDLDFAVANHDDRTVSVYTNTGGGVYAAGVTLTVDAQRRPGGIDSADLDNDGDDDLAVASNDLALMLESATVFVSLGTGAFNGPFHYPTGGTNTSYIAAADLDCDTFTDLVTGNEDSGNISLLPNLGNGTFGGATMLVAGTTPSGVTPADLDGDGDQDVAVANRDSNDVTVHINQTCLVGTLVVALGCVPDAGILPFTTQFTASLENTTVFNRRAAGRIEIITAGGALFPNWRSGFTNLSPGELFTAVFNQTIPALGSLIGANHFNLVGEDVTPAPFNQPPYPDAGDTDTAGCTVTGLAP